MAKFESKGMRKRLTKDVPLQGIGNLLNPAIRDLVHAHRARRILLSPEEQIPAGDIVLLEQWWVSNLSKGSAGLGSFIIIAATMTACGLTMPSKLPSLEVALLVAFFAATAFASYFALKPNLRYVIRNTYLPRLRAKYPPRPSAGETSGSKKS